MGKASLVRHWRRRQWHPSPVLLPGKSHGWRSLVGSQSMGLLRVGHDWATSLSLFTFMHRRSKWQPTPVFLLGESQGRGIARQDFLAWKIQWMEEPDRLQSMGLQRDRHDRATSLSLGVKVQWWTRQAQSLVSWCLLLMEFLAHSHYGHVVRKEGRLVALSCLTLCDPWTIACQDPLFMGFSRQEYWSGLPFPSPGHL